MAKLHLGARKIDRLAAHLADADIEGDPRAGRGLFEDQGDDPIRERALAVRTHARPAIPRRLHARSVIEDRAKFLRRNPVEIEEITLHHADSFFAAALMRAQAVSSRSAAALISSAEQVSGGRRRI